jgi:formylglycine-generating enzyme required for sulfatase activity/serine/threonine protein kinase
MSTEEEDVAQDSGIADDANEMAKTIVNFEQTIVNFSADEAPSIKKVTVVKKGYVFLERYRVKDELGKGAMGVVYLCEDEVAGIDVALKAIPPEIGNDRVEMESVRENFQIVHKLHHPNIANVNTLECDRNTGDYYLIMECVPGVNLWQYYKAKGFNPSLSMTMPLLKQIASALDYAHDQEIIHRDIKPSNIQVMDDATVKILDYGLAQQIQNSMMRVTGHSYSKGGTPFFMAPEQWKGTHQDGTTDQYAFAVVIFQLITGKCPFQSTDMMVLREMVLNEKPIKPNEFNDQEWKVIRRALEKERIARFKSCAELIEHLEKAVTMTSSSVRNSFEAANTQAKKTGPASQPFSHRDSRRSGARTSARKGPRRNVRPEPTQKALLAGAVLFPLLIIGIPLAAFLAWNYSHHKYQNKQAAYSDFMAQGIKSINEKDWNNARKFARSAVATGWHDSARAKRLELVTNRGIGPSPGTLKTFDLGEGVSMEMRWIPPGYFTRGSFFNGHYDEEPAHRVMMPRGFWLGQYEVTQQEWGRVIGQNPSINHGDRLPVDNVEHQDARTYCEELSRLLSETVRLPTEAEWEYACRAGKHTLYSYGNDPGKLSEYANFCDGANGSGFAWQLLSQNDGFDQAAPVGSFKPNSWNLYDMMGNVTEWCSDFYGGYAGLKQEVDPKGPLEGKRYVVRGGSWASAPAYCRSAARTDFLVTKPPAGSYGFRVVIEQPVQ